jgi:hypothetical protein
MLAPERTTPAAKRQDRLAAGSHEPGTALTGAIAMMDLLGYAMLLIAAPAITCVLFVSGLWLLMILPDLLTLWRPRS